MYMEETKVDRPNGFSRAKAWKETTISSVQRLFKEKRHAWMLGLVDGASNEHVFETIKYNFRYEVPKVENLTRV